MWPEGPGGTRARPCTVRCGALGRRGEERERRGVNSQLGAQLKSTVLLENIRNQGEKVIFKHVFLNVSQTLTLVRVIQVSVQTADRVLVSPPNPKEATACFPSPSLLLQSFKRTVPLTRRISGPRGHKVVFKTNRWPSSSDLIMKRKWCRSVNMSSF